MDSNPTPIDVENGAIIDSNGTKYLVRWDRGWFDIMRVEKWGEEWYHVSDEIVSFTPEGCDELKEAMEAGR